MRARAVFLGPAQGAIGPPGPAGPAGADGAAGAPGTDGAGYGGTSATSLTIGTGSKAFTTQAGLAYTVGARVRATRASDTTKWMEGLVTAYSGTTLTVLMDLTNGAGTFSDWDLNVAGERGATGATGATGSNGAAGADGGDTAEVLYSNVDATSYGTSGVPYIPLAKNATEQYLIFVRKAWKTGTLKITLVYAMSASNSGDVALENDYLKVADGGDLNGALTTQSSFTFTPGTGTTQKSLDQAAQSTLGLSVTAGDLCLFKISRKNVGGDTHTGSLNVVDVRVRIE